MAFKVMSAIAVAVIVGALASGAPPVANAESAAMAVKLPKQIIIASNRVGGVANTMANGFAKVLTQHVGTKATVRAVGNAAKWMGMIKSGDIDLGMTSVTELSWAYWGTNAYTGKPNRTFALIALGRQQSWAFMVPARTGMRPAVCSTTAEMIWVRSSSVTLRNSPVEPSAMRPGTPLSICQSTKRRSAFSSTAEPSSVNGVNMTV